MISHREAEALISARLDQQLDPVAERVLTAHLATCNQCRAFDRASNTLVSGLRELPYLPPSSAVSRRVMARVDEGRSPWIKFGGLINSNPGPAISTFAIIAVLFLLGFFMLNRFVLDERGNPGDDNNQLASRPTAAPTQSVDFTIAGTPEPTVTQEPTATEETVATEPPTATTSPTEKPTDVLTETPAEAPTNEPTEPPTEEPTTAPTETTAPEPTATEPEPTESPAPTETPTSAPKPTSAPTEPPTEETVTINRSISDESPSGIFDLTTSPESQEAEATATPYLEPVATPTAPSTEAPTLTVPPTPTVEATAPEPTATATTAPTATPEPTEEEAPPILPINGEVVQAPEDVTSTGEVTSEITKEPQAEPTATTAESGDVPIQAIGPSDQGSATDGTGGETIEPAGSESTRPTPEQGGIEPVNDEETPTATTEPEAKETAAPEGVTDLEASSDVYGDIAGERGGRLILDGGRMEYGPQAHPAIMTSVNGFRAQAISGPDGQAVGICAPDGECTDLSSASSDGAATDEPLGWTGGGVIYSRIENNTVWYRFLVPDESGSEVVSDIAIYDGGIDLAPTLPIYQAEGRIWVITSGGDWLVLTANSGQRLSNSFAGAHDLRFATTGNQGLLVGYVSGGQLIIAPGDDPGNPKLVLPFSGVDFDIAPAGNQIAVSTGSSIEVYDLDGTLVETFASDGVQPGTVLWLNSGLVYVDTASGVLMQIPELGQ